MVTPLAVVLLVLMGFMAALWSYSIRIRNGAVADVGWGLGFIIAAWLHLALASGAGVTAWIMAGVLTLWGFRLSLFIWRDRVAGGRPEDARYREFRDKWGKRADLNLFGFFQLQALLIVVVSLPMAVAAHDPGTGYGGFQAAGLLLWIAAFAGEVVSDSQLKNFKSRPENRGRVLDTGLWRHSRHPNYFFEWL
ncbi:MAG TPA: DUF1295 domain-containing protein, partial [Candidatus Krumholzibacterium sp.]|nr:DUF1295 domain-containing protein [Candidatus Krumholzibacterium sp.]